MVFIVFTFYVKERITDAWLTFYKKKRLTHLSYLRTALYSNSEMFPTNIQKDKLFAF